MDECAYGMEKSAAQVIEELRAQRDAMKRDWMDLVHERDTALVALAEARDLLQAWREGKEPALATSRWLTRNGGGQ